MGKLGKILLGAAIGVGAVAAAPFTGGGSVLAGASLAASLTGAGAIAGVGAVAGATAGAIADNVETKQLDKKIAEEKTSSFRDGVNEGKILTAEEIRKYADFYLATSALSYYFARCDGEISEEEQLEIDHDLDAVYKNKDIPTPIKNELYQIANNKNITFDIVKNYLDKVSVDTLKILDLDIDEIIRASGGINEKEKAARNLFNKYLKERENE